MAGCSINVNGDLSDPQPLLIKPGTSTFIYPEDRAGIVYLDDNQEIEIYCTSGLRVPAGVGNSAIAKCINGNMFEVAGTLYSFRNFTCNSIPFHTTRKTTTRCFNGGIKIDIGFDLGTRFLKVLDVCHDESSEETYFAKYQLTPASEGLCWIFIDFSKITFTFDFYNQFIKPSTSRISKIIPKAVFRHWGLL